MMKLFLSVFFSFDDDDDDDDDNDNDDDDHLFTDELKANAVTRPTFLFSTSLHSNLFLFFSIVRIV